MLTSCCVFEYFRIPFSNMKYLWNIRGIVVKTNPLIFSHCRCGQVLSSYTDLVPALEWVFPPLHQKALAYPRNSEIQRGARNRILFQLLQVLHHFPVTRLHRGHIHFHQLIRTGTQRQKDRERQTERERERQRERQTYHTLKVCSVYLKSKINSSK